MHYPNEAPDPIEAIKIGMGEMHFKQVDLVDAIWVRLEFPRLNRKRKLTVESI